MARQGWGRRYFGTVRSRKGQLHSLETQHFYQVDSSPQICSPEGATAATSLGFGGIGVRASWGLNSTKDRLLSVVPKGTAVFYAWKVSHNPSREDTPNCPYTGKPILAYILYQSKLLRPNVPCMSKAPGPLPVFLGICDFCFSWVLKSCEKHSFFNFFF